MSGSVKAAIDDRDIAIVIVAAIGENNAIGIEGALPWRLKSDLAHFRTLTIGRPVVMGRKTFTSIGKPLKDRTNIVVTRDLSLIAPGAVLATSIDAALAVARGDATERGVKQIMVIGGSDIFAATMPEAARLEITHVHASPEGDVYFPPIDPNIWREVSRQEHSAGADDSASFAVATYLRR
jgi:dihydrofolate reductase